MRTSGICAGISLSVLAIAGCATAPDGNRDLAKLMVGCWEGRDFQPVFDRHASWFLQRHADGTFEIEFRVPGQPPQRETGSWRVAGATYTTVTTTVDDQPVDLHDPHFTDVYELGDVSARSMAYSHPASGMNFQSSRVACPADD